MYVAQFPQYASALLDHLCDVKVSAVCVVSCCVRASLRGPPWRGRVVCACARVAAWSDLIHPCKCEVGPIPVFFLSRAHADTSVCHVRRVCAPRWATGTARSASLRLVLLAPLPQPAQRRWLRG